MSFKQRKQASTVLAGVSTGYAKDPLELTYGKEDLDIDESFVIRILSLDEQDAPLQRKRSCKCAYIKDGVEINEYSFDVAEPKDKALLETIYDDDDVAMADCPSKDMWIIPVLVMYKTNKSGKKVGDDINEVRYVKFGPGLAKGLKKMSENEEDGFNFDTIPFYDVRLKVVKKDSKSPKNYEVKPVVKSYDAKGKFVDDPHFGEEDLEAALGPDLMSVIDEQWDTVQEAIQKLIDEESKPDNIKKRFLHYRKKKSDGGATSERSSGMKRSLKDTEEEPEENTENENEDEPEAEEVDNTPAFKGAARRSFRK